MGHCCMGRASSGERIEEDCLLLVQITAILFLNKITFTCGILCTILYVLYIRVVHEYSLDPQSATIDVIEVLSVGNAVDQYFAVFSGMR
jgi:hypothetical protein